MRKSVSGFAQKRRDNQKPIDDHLGSASVLTDASSNTNASVTERSSYDAWGRRRNADGSDDTSCSLTSASPRGYTGHEHLASTCLINANARVYDPTIARFMAADPITADWYDGQGINRFSYVNNRPLVLTDPTGMATDEENSAGVVSRACAMGPQCSVVFFDTSTSSKTADAGPGIAGSAQVGSNCSGCYQVAQAGTLAGAAAGGRTGSPAGPAGAALGAAAGILITNIGADEGRRTVYRVVGPKELAYIKVHGNYGSNPNSSGKYFALGLGGAQSFLNHPVNKGFSLTTTTLPESLINQGYNFFDPGRFGAGQSVFFNEEQLPTVNGSITPISVLSGPR